MADRSKIEWTDASWNPIRAHRGMPDGSEPRIGWHCVHVSEGCRNCYAESFNERLGTGLPYKPGHLLKPLEAGQIQRRGDVSLFVDPEMLRKPLHWKRARKIFVCSMTDLFGEFMEDAWIDQLFSIMALAPRHRFQVLTKRPARMLDYLSASHRRRAIADAAFEIQGTSGKDQERLWPPADWLHGDGEWPLPNVWIGTSVEDQAAAEERIPILLETPAAIRWLSMEPLLGAVDLSEWLFCPTSLDHPPSMDPTTGAYECCSKCDYTGIAGFSGDPIVDWIVIGGESGAGARPMAPDWARHIRDQAAAAAVPFLFKQWGEYVPSGVFAALDLGERAGRVPERHLSALTMYRVGKKLAGRELDGVLHDGYPA